jgi:hypothetical protein
VVGQSGKVEFEGRRRTAARRLQADPPEPVARRRGLVGEEPEPVERPKRVVRLWFRLSHHLGPHPEHGRNEHELKLHLRRIPFLSLANPGRGSPFREVQDVTTLTANRHKGARGRGVGYDGEKQTFGLVAEKSPVSRLATWPPRPLQRGGMAPA